MTIGGVQARIIAEKEEEMQAKRPKVTYVAVVATVFTLLPISLYQSK